MSSPNHHDTIQGILATLVLPLGLRPKLTTGPNEPFSVLSWNVRGAHEQAAYDALTSAGFPCEARGERGQILRINHPATNWLVIIGYTGNRKAYLNVPEAEARRRFLTEANEGMPDDCQKTELDEPVEVKPFHDSFDCY